MSRREPPAQSSTSTSTSTSTSAYHHGDLPNALRASAVDVIRSHGLHGFSLREVARRAGVSHAAPGYHFGDARGLLTAVAVEGFETLRDALALAVEGIDDPIDRLVAIGRGYVRVATEHPAHCEVMFRDDVLEADDEQLATEGLGAYEILETTVAQLAARYNPRLEVQPAARLCWSAMQGLVALHAKFSTIDALQGRPTMSLDEHVERFTRLMVDGLLHEEPTQPARPPRRPTRR
ncbi:MAG: TetR/AcrR family transcriptional regulator [Ilumatobacteraceae bacterium]